MARFRIVTIALLFGLGVLAEAAAGLGFGLELSAGAMLFPNLAALSGSSTDDSSDGYTEGNDNPASLFLIGFAKLPLVPIPDLSGSVSLRLGDHFGLGLSLRTWLFMITVLSFYAELDLERFTFTLGSGGIMAGGGSGNFFKTEAVFKFTSHFQLGLGALVPLIEGDDDEVLVASSPLVYIALKWVWRPFGSADN
jgi:hypothetical protein